MDEPGHNVQPHGIAWTPAKAMILGLLVGVTIATVVGLALAVLL